jgi:imidazolonepropionase-like amidohydrolase
MRLSKCTPALRFCILVLAFSLAAAPNATAATKAVKFGKLWDGHGTIANAVVIVENDKIQSVAASGTIPAGAEIIDLSLYTGMPGMIDSHTHMTYYWDPRPAPIHGTSRRGIPR